MSKSLKRVETALVDLGLDARVLEMPGETRTAEQAAAEAGCALDQIVKSIIFRGHDSDAAILFLTAGGNQVDPERARAVAGEGLDRADAAFVRARTGFAIGGVAPLGHLSPPRVFADPRLMAFDVVWAAAGTPRHIFSCAPGPLFAAVDAPLAEFVSV